MKHFDGGGCSLGDEHAGPYVWAVTNKSEPVTNSIPVIDAVTNTPAVTNSITNSERVLAWRATNKAKYNSYQREYMRRYRADS